MPSLPAGSTAKKETRQNAPKAVASKSTEPQSADNLRGKAVAEMPKIPEPKAEPPKETSDANAQPESPKNGRMAHFASGSLPVAARTRTRYAGTSMLLLLRSRWGSPLAVFAVGRSLALSSLYAATPSSPPGTSVSTVQVVSVRPMRNRHPRHLRPIRSGRSSRRASATGQRALCRRSLSRVEAQSLRAAHDLDPQPIFLFNIAQSLRRGQQELRGRAWVPSAPAGGGPKHRCAQRPTGTSRTDGAAGKAGTDRTGNDANRRGGKPWFWDLWVAGVALVATDWVWVWVWDFAIHALSSRFSRNAFAAGSAEGKSRQTRILCSFAFVLLALPWSCSNNTQLVNVAVDGLNPEIVVWRCSHRSIARPMGNSR